MIQILIVDDEKPICDLIQMSLTRAGYHCTCVYDELAAADILERNVFDLILLDVMLPKMDGLEMCRKIREKHNVPIIMVSAKTQELDKIVGLTTGADDYVTKPFDIKEVTARVEVQIRRAETTGRKEEEHRFTYQELELNKGDFTVKVGNTELPHITKQEFLGTLFIAARDKDARRTYK